MNASGGVAGFMFVLSITYSVLYAKHTLLSPDVRAQACCALFCDVIVAFGDIRTVYSNDTFVCMLPTCCDCAVMVIDIDAKVYAVGGQENGGVVFACACI